MFDPVVVIPVYNHPRTIEAMVGGALAATSHCIVVDDGSDAACAAVLDALAARLQPRVSLLRLPDNQGKGVALALGFREAARRGHSHALQIDADAQHATSDMAVFLDRARANPEAVICGCPIYDASVPMGRLAGRYLTHVWVWINTLSLDIRDSMCGFRVYPLASTLAVLEATRVGRRMDFDSEVIVRLHWRGVPVLNQPTRVVYPRDGVSHFRLWRDNCLISAMHARLFAGMLLRLPSLMRKRRAAPKFPRTPSGGRL